MFDLLMCKCSCISLCCVKEGKCKDMLRIVCLLKVKVKTVSARWHWRTQDCHIVFSMVCFHSTQWLASTPIFCENDKKMGKNIPSSNHHEWTRQRESARNWPTDNQVLRLSVLGQVTSGKCSAKPTAMIIENQRCQKKDEKKDFEKSSSSGRLILHYCPHIFAEKY